MKKFIARLFSNRFGIVLATLNVCYLAIKFQDVGNIPQTFLGRVFICLNMPAFIFTRLVYEIGVVVFADSGHSVQMPIALGLFTFFIILQWLFIAWIARTLAAKIRQPKL